MALQGYIKQGNKMVEIGNQGIPVGLPVAWLGKANTIPVGFLLANGASVSKTTYPALFDVYGYAFGGEGEYFNLPNLNNGTFLEGASVAGVFKEAGLPNITGSFNGIRQNADGAWNQGIVTAYGAMSATNITLNPAQLRSASSTATGASYGVEFDASRSSSVYGNSDTVQPKSVTVVYIVKAFSGASADSTDLEITKVANDLVTTQASLSALIDNADVVASGTNYIRYANGIQMCWGNVNWSGTAYYDFDLPLPFIDNLYSLQANYRSGSNTAPNVAISVNQKTNNSVHLLLYGSTQAYISYLAIGRWK